MNDEIVIGLTLSAAIGSGLIAGVFFAFSTFVMPALKRLPPEQGIASMQSINITAINPSFMLALFGTALASGVLAVATLSDPDDARSVYMLVGSGLYLGGTVLVTIVCNVPRNNTLAAVEPTSAAGASVWGDYQPGWTTWNHVRTIFSLAATVSFILALRQ